jgi:hypothetical protein
MARLTRVCRVHRRERARRHRGAARREHVIQDSRPGERVAEHEGIAVDGKEQRGEPRLERLRHHRVRHARRRAQEPPVEVRTEQSRRVQHEALVRTERLEACPHTVRQRVRHTRRRQDLLDEERQAVSRALHLLHEIVVGVGRAGTHHVGHLLGPQPSEANERGRAATMQTFGCREPGRPRLATSRHHPQHGLAGEVVGQVFDDFHRVRIGPMQILENDDQTPPCRPTPQHTDERLASYRRRHVTVPVPPRVDRRQHRRQRRKPRAQIGVVGNAPLARRLGQHLGQRSIGRTRAPGDRPAHHHEEALRSRLVSDLASQPRLTDSRLAGDEHHPAATLGRAGESITHCGKLPGSPDHPRAQHRSHALTRTARRPTWKADRSRGRSPRSGRSAQRPRALPSASRQIPPAPAASIAVAGRPEHTPSVGLASIATPGSEEGRGFRSSWRLRQIREGHQPPRCTTSANARRFGVTIGRSGRSAG